jgi:hypothetical protein
MRGRTSLARALPRRPPRRPTTSSNSPCHSFRAFARNVILTRRLTCNFRSGEARLARSLLETSGNERDKESYQVEAHVRRIDDFPYRIRSSLYDDFFNRSSQNLLLLRPLPTSMAFDETLQD